MLEPIERFAPIGGRLDSVSLQFEQCLNRAADVVMIIDD
jgi:hypothetical protein